MGMKVQKNNKGFTLVEVICAVTIMMLVVVPIFTGFLMAAKTNAAIGDKLEISMMLENELESIKATGKITNVKLNETDILVYDLERGEIQATESAPNADIKTFDKTISVNDIDYSISITVEAIPVSDSDKTIAYYTIILVYSAEDAESNQTEEHIIKGVYAPW